MQSHDSYPYVYVCYKSHNCIRQSDSTIFSEKDGEQRFETSSKLGVFVNELKPNQRCVSIISAGPKNYCLKMEDGSTFCKVRGFTLSHENAKVRNYESMHNLVYNEPENTLKTIEKECIHKDKYNSNCIIRI